MSALIRVPESSDFDDAISVLRRSQFLVVQSRCMYRPAAATRDIGVPDPAGVWRHPVDIGYHARRHRFPDLAAACRIVRGGGLGPGRRGRRLAWRLSPPHETTEAVACPIR